MYNRMRYLYPLLSHTREIRMVENRYTYVFTIPLIRSQLDAYPILPKVMIKNDNIYIVCLKNII